MVLVVWFLQWSIFHDQTKTRSHFLTAQKLQVWIVFLKFEMPCRLSFCLVTPHVLGRESGEFLIFDQKEMLSQNRFQTDWAAHTSKKKNWDFQNGVAQMCWSKPGFSSLLWRDFTDTSSPFFPFPSVRTCKDRISTWQLKINHPCIQGTIEAAWRVAKEVPSWHGFFFRRNVGDSELWLTPEKFGEWIHKMKLCKR